jgi:predicted nucleotidyltransferase
MTRKIDLSAGDLAILRTVLDVYLPPGATVWIFGSRATGRARQYSDVDLALEDEGPLNLDLLGRLKDALSESDLTIKVDLVDLQAVDPAFRQIIESQMVPLRLSAASG